MQITIFNRVLYCIVFIEQEDISHGKSNSNYELFAELFAESRSTNSAQQLDRYEIARGNQFGIRLTDFEIRADINRRALGMCNVSFYGFTFLPRRTCEVVIQCHEYSPRRYCDAFSLRNS